MSEGELSRIKGDLAVMQQALGLHLSFGKGMLVVGVLLTAAAAGAAILSLLVESAWLQVAPLAAIMILVPVGLFVQSRRSSLGPEIIIQVMLSVTVYSVVWIAACGYALAAFVGPTVGAARTAALYAVSSGLLITFTVLLARSALRSREKYYCLGLALSTLLAGTLLPVLDQQYSFALAHCFMALGLLTNVVIQWVQLQEAAGHAAD